MVQSLAGTKEIMSRTGNIPYPYSDGLAESWIQTHEQEFTNGTGVINAVTLKLTQELIGGRPLVGISKTNCKGEIAYWVAEDHWNKGHCTEAATAIVKYAFENLQLNKITSRHLAWNSASGKVMQKIGMKQEGVLRQETCKDEQFHDLVVYGLLKSEYMQNSSTGPGAVNRTKILSDSLVLLIGPIQ